MTWLVFIVEGPSPSRCWEEPFQLLSDPNLAVLPAQVLFSDGWLPGMCRQPPCAQSPGRGAPVSTRCPARRFSPAESESSRPRGPEVMGTEPGFEHGSLSVWPRRDWRHVGPQPGLQQEALSLVAPGQWGAGGVGVVPRCPRPLCAISPSGPCGPGFHFQTGSTQTLILIHSWRRAMACHLCPD